MTDLTALPHCPHCKEEMILGGKGWEHRMPYCVGVLTELATGTDHVPIGFPGDGNLPPRHSEGSE